MTANVLSAAIPSWADSLLPKMRGTTECGGLGLHLCCEIPFFPNRFECHCGLRDCAMAYGAFIINIIFLLINWYFHIMHLITLNSSLPRSAPPPLCASPYNKRKGRKKSKVQFLFSIYSLEHIQTPSSQTLKEKWVLPHWHPHQNLSIVVSSISAP